MALQALWDVTQQFNHKNGSILTSGKIYIYYKGRTALATSYHDEDGTVVNSNPVLLDNNGRATAFVNPIYSYTIVVCDYYGKELFSQDITLHDAISTAEDVVVIGTDGSVLVDTTQLPNGVQYDLSVNTDIIATKQSVDDVKDDLDDLTVIVNNHTTQIGQLQDDVEDLEDALATKKDKQQPYSSEGGVTQTITKVEQDSNGNINVTYSDIDLPPEVPTVEITSPNGTMNIASSIDVETNTKTFEIDVKNSDPVWHYWTGNNAWTQIATKSWTQINRPAIGAGSNPHPWNPDIKRGIYDTKAHFTVTFHNYNNSKTVPNQIIQVGFRAKFVGKNDPSAIRYEDLGAWTYDPSLYTTEAYQYNFAQESLRQNHDTSKILNVANYWGDTDFDVYFEAALLNTDGSQDVPPIDTVLMAEITYFGYHEVKGNVNSQGGGTTYTAGDGIDITNDVISTDIQVQNDQKVNVNLDFGNTIQTVNIISTDGSTVRTDGFNFTLPTIKAGDGIEFTKVGTETTISMDSEVGDVVETVEKLKKDLDTQITTNFDMPNISQVYDFADGNNWITHNGACMLYQSFTIPINHELRTTEDDADTPTLLGIYAQQNFAHKIMLALYEYTYAAEGEANGSSTYVGDTGPVTVLKGMNEFPLKNRNPSITELRSDKVYYASLYLPSTAFVNGLYLGGCPGYGNASIPAEPRLTCATENITWNGQELDLDDPTTTLNHYQVIQIPGQDTYYQYYIGPWVGGYNERWSTPRFYMQIRNGEFNEPVIPTVPFNTLGDSKLPHGGILASNLPNFSSSTSNSAFRDVTPMTNVTITSFEWIDSKATAGGWEAGNCVFNSDYSTNLSGVSNSVVDLGEVYHNEDYTAYAHRITFTTPIALTAGTTYRFLCSSWSSSSDWIWSWTVPTDVFDASNNGWYIDWSQNVSRYSHIAGHYNKLYDSNNNHYVI